MAEDEPPEQPKNGEIRNQQDKYVAAIRQQIGVPLADLTNQINTFVKDIKTEAEASERQRQKHHDEHQLLIRRGTNWTIFLSFATFLVSIFTAYILYNTLRAYKLDQRAWVGPLNTAKPEIVNGEIIITIRFTNTGKLPARDLKIMMDRKLFAKGEKITRDFSKAVPTTESSSLSMLPTTRIEQHSKPMTVTPDEIAAIKNGDPILRVFGVFNYDTTQGFRGGGKFCFFLSKTLESVSVCETYNELY